MPPAVDYLPSADLLRPPGPSLLNTSLTDFADELLRAGAWETGGDDPVPTEDALYTTGPKVTLDDLFIRTKKKTMVRFVPNSLQRKYLDTIMPRWELGEYNMSGLRELILKFRQPGMSTLVLAIMFLDTINNPHTQTVVIAHDKPTTLRLFETVKRFYKHLPPAKRPRAQYASKYEYYWPEIDSGFFVGTAGNADFGRSATINNIHGTEVAMWPNADEILSGLLQTCPANGNIILESTAKGMGNWFHTEYTEAKRGKSTFTSRFFAWFEHDEYQVEPEKVPLDMTEGLTVKELQTEATLRDIHHVAPAQLIWRREKVQELKRKFPQEYPASDAEAFISSGNTYFDAEQLLLLYQQIEGGGVDGEHLPVPAVVPSNLVRLRARYAAGDVQFWKLPEPGRWYVISSDTAEGVNRDGKHDWDSADVFDGKTWEQVAHIHCQISTFEFGMTLGELGTWYNRALLVVERNNSTGGAVLNTLVNSYHYPRQDAGQRHGLYYAITIDRNGKATEAPEPGWLTTGKSKYTALDGLAESLAEEALILHSAITVGEMQTFSKLPGNKVGGEKGSHDDAVISCAIGDAILKLPRSTASSGRIPREGITRSAGSRPDTLYSAETRTGNMRP